MDKPINKQNNSQRYAVVAGRFYNMSIVQISKENICVSYQNGL